MDATNQLKQAFALSCFQLIKWWKRISPTPRNLFHNQIPCQPLSFSSLEKLQVEKVGRKGRMNRNEKHWRHYYISPYLEIIIWQKLMSMVIQRKEKKKAFVCPHLLISQTHLPKDFAPRFQKGGNGKKEKSIQILSIKPIWKVLFLLTVILFLQKRAFPSHRTPAPRLTPSICKQTYLSFFLSKALCVKGRDANNLMTAASLRKCL